MCRRRKRHLHRAAILCAALFWTGCGDGRDPVGAGEETPPREEIRILALGDSYTVGEGVTEAESWPGQLVASLADTGVTVSTRRLIAQTGWTTTDLIAAIEQAPELVPGFSLVTLQIGVNNQFIGMPLDTYRREFSELLDIALTFAGGDTNGVLVLSIPDYSATPVGSMFDPEVVAAEIDRYNAINLDISRTAGVRYANITPISRQAATERGLVARDGLHPSARMYGRWVALILPDVLAAVAPEPRIAPAGRNAL